MPAIVRFPEVVEQALVVLGPLFQNRRQRQHPGEYLTGLYVAQRTSVNGINAEFADATDQSRLNRRLNESPWDVSALDEARLAELQKRHDTRCSKYGVIAVDETLIDHDGKLTETFHRDGKQHLGLGDCQLGSGEGQTRRTRPVFLAYSLSLPRMSGNRARDWSTAPVSSVGDACRAALRTRRPKPSAGSWTRCASTHGRRKKSAPRWRLRNGSYKSGIWRFKRPIRETPGKNRKEKWPQAYAESKIKPSSKA